LACGDLGAICNLDLARSKLRESELAAVRWAGKQAVRKAVQQALDSVELRMSLFRAGSGLSQFKLVPPGRLVTPSHDLHGVLTAAPSASAPRSPAPDASGTTPCCSAPLDWRRTGAHCGRRKMLGDGRPAPCPKRGAS
jgi:hypothetical protein